MPHPENPHGILLEREQDAVVANAQPERAGHVSVQRVHIADITMGWTQITRDVGGRTTDVRSIAGASPSGSATGFTTTTYSTGAGAGGRTGRMVTSTEDGGATRTQLIDALGRLTEVDESCTGCTTKYDYYATGELKQVLQASQTRTFGYDFRGLLLNATNPESGTSSYTYRCQRPHTDGVRNSEAPLALV